MTQRPIDEAAKQLPRAAKIFATNSYLPALQRHAFMRSISPERWDLVVAAAAISVAFNSLLEMVEGDEFQRLFRVVEAVAAEYGEPIVPMALDGFKFVHDQIANYSVETEPRPAAILGLWVVLHLLERRPEDPEVLLGLEIGHMVVQGFSGWWGASSKT